jgi:hypothetical protein
MSAHPVRFDDLVETFDRLPLDERESLVEIGPGFAARQASALLEFTSGA